MTQPHRNLPALLAVLLVLCTACGFANANRRTAAENLQTKIVELQDFDAVDVSDNIRVIYTPNAVPGAKISGPAELVEAVTLTQQGREVRLTLKPMPRDYWQTHAREQHTVCVYLSSKGLNSLRARGNASIRATAPMRAAAFTLALADNAAADDIDLSVHDALTIDLRDNARAHDLDARAATTNVSARDNSGLDADIEGLKEAVCVVRDNASAELDLKARQRAQLTVRDNASAKIDLENCQQFSIDVADNASAKLDCERCGAGTASAHGNSSLTLKGDARNVAVTKNGNASIHRNELRTR